MTDSPDPTTAVRAAALVRAELAARTSYGRLLALLAAGTHDIAGAEDALADALLDAVIYDAHPYGHPVDGRAGVLPTLDAVALRRFHGRA